MVRKATKDNFKFGVNPCSVCENVTLTLGQQRWGGIRYCETCLHETLGWLQLGENGQKTVTTAFEKLRQDKRVVKLLDKAKGITDEEKKAVSIGEARRRCYEADLAPGREP